MEAPISNSTLEIIAFHLGEQQFCIRTTAIREIRGWAAATPLPHAPPDVLGVMNLRDPGNRPCGKAWGSQCHAY